MKPHQKETSIRVQLLPKAVVHDHANQQHPEVPPPAARQAAPRGKRSRISQKLQAVIPVAMTLIFDMLLGSLIAYKFRCGCAQLWWDQGNVALCLIYFCLTLCLNRWSAEIVLVLYLLFGQIQPPGICWYPSNAKITRMEYLFSSLEKRRERERFYHSFYPRQQTPKHWLPGDRVRNCIRPRASYEYNIHIPL